MKPPASKRSARPVRGDVFEISTPHGKAYLQYVNYDADMGEFIRILPGTYQEQPSIDTLMAQAERFATFFPLGAALRRGIVRWVAKADWPPEHDRFPTLRSPGYVNPSTGKIENWWLWDGAKSWRVDSLTEAERRLSLKSIMNDTLLIERIVSGWQPSDFM